MRRNWKSLAKLAAELSRLPESRVWVYSVRSKRWQTTKQREKVTKMVTEVGGRFVCELSLLAHSFPQGELQVWGFSLVGVFM